LAGSTIEPVKAGIAIAGLFVTGLALFVGAIGIMNITYVSVKERTREIGTRKAVGARRSDIIWQFLTEAVTLTGVGGLAGLLVGWGLAALVSALIPALVMRIPLWAAAFGFFGSLTVGLVFGLWPAVKAARLDPIVALRHE